ncbi:MAG: DUF1080 domain-containing protein [Verrucomicrobia bacterium]|nr:MAG: DUF1080 domain-containing protein [Verrucomicrobiota bacterium]
MTPFAVLSIAFFAAPSILLSMGDSSIGTSGCDERPEAGKNGWQTLFDGRTTEGWRGYHRDTIPDGWFADDGVFRREGKGGDLMTVEQFADFELHLEWRLEPGGNSGVILRVSEEGDKSWHSGPEMQILDDEAHQPDLKPKNASGALYDLVPVPEGAGSVIDEWNTVRIMVDGSRYRFWLNGVQTVDLDLESPEGQRLIAASKFARYPGFGREARGHIVLQDHGAKVEFRHILIREL